MRILVRWDVTETFRAEIDVPEGEDVDEWLSSMEGDSTLAEAEADDANYQGTPDRDVVEWEEVEG